MSPTEIVQACALAISTGVVVALAYKVRDWSG